jgi:hypothetical protein
MKPLQQLLTLALLVNVTAGATTYPGNGNSGFAGAIGLGSLTLTDDGTNISGTVTKGSGGFNDVLVLYIDTGIGGFGDTSGFADSADGLRRAISGFDGGANRSVLTNPAGFTPDYAIALGPNSESLGGLYKLANGGANSLNLLTSVNLAPVGTATAATYTFSFNVAAIGLATNSGASFKLFGTYISDTGYRSTEAISGNDSGAQGWNPFNVTAVTNYTIHDSAIKIVYGVNLVIGAGGVVGTITTDGHIGVIGASDILAWNFIVTGNGGATYHLVNGPSGVDCGNNTDVFNPNAGTPDLTADANHIYFNFNGTDGGYVGFQTLPFYGGNNYWSCGANNNSDVAQGFGVVPVLYSDPSSIYVAESGNQIIATVSAPPTLAIQPATNGVVLLWPVSPTIYRLQQTTNLTAANWVSNTIPLNVVNGTNQVTVSPAAGKMFYRLINP